MATGQNLLFSCDAVNQLPDLKRPQLILEALPDEALLAVVAFQHPSRTSTYRTSGRFTPSSATPEPSYRRRAGAGAAPWDA